MEHRLDRARIEAAERLHVGEDRAELSCEARHVLLIEIEGRERRDPAHLGGIDLHDAR
jgi:hypothetical protein